MYRWIDIFSISEKMAKISIIIKSQNLLKMKSYSRFTVKMFHLINKSHTKNHSFLPNLKQNCEKKKYIISRQCRYTNTFLSEEKNSENNINIEENTISNEKCFKEIANGNADIEKKLKILEFEININREYNKKVPKVISKENWEELLQLKNKKARYKYLSYLFVTEIRQNSDKEKVKVQQRYESWKNKEENELHLSYGIGKNCLFLRLYENSLNKLKHLRLLGALCYSQHIVFDCSYDSFMSKRNKKFCAKQILESFSYNRNHQAPLHLKLCNVNMEDESIKILSKFLGQQLNFFLDVTKESYLDLYPKDKLVYLTPHATNVLREYKEDDIYIIGAFVDRGIGDQISLGKAKEQNLRMAKLPLDQYLVWQKGSKNLPLNIVIQILADMRFYRSWDIALKNVPRRFISQNTKPTRKPKHKFYCSI